MKHRTQLKTAAAAAGVLALLVGLMLAFPLVQAAGDEALFAKAQPLPLPAGELAPKAEDIPLVLDLQNKARYYDFTAFEAADNGFGGAQDLAGVPQKAVETRSFAELAEVYQSLSAAGIMPDEVRSTMGGPAADSEVEYRTVAQDFVRFGDALLHGGKVVGLWLLAPQAAMQDFDQDAACQNYLAYLRLDVLDDWQPARFYEPSGLRGAGLYSAGAQLLLQVMVDTRGGMDGAMVGVMATPLSREAFAEQNILPEGEDVV